MRSDNRVDSRLPTRVSEADILDGQQRVESTRSPCEWQVERTDSPKDFWSCLLPVVYDAHAVASLAFGAIQRTIRPPHQVIESLAVLRNSNAERYGETSLELGPIHLANAQPFDGRTELLGNRPSAGDGGMRQQHGEFLTPPASDKIASLDILVQDAADRANGLVAEQMSMCVVDLLEVINVDNEKRGAV